MVFKSTIRLDILDESYPDRFRKFIEKYDQYLVYHEISDKEKKPHYQGIIIFEDESKFRSGRVRFYDTFRDATKGHKSMAAVKNDNYQVYITKDKDLRYSKGFSDEVIRNLEELSFKKNSKEFRSTTFARAHDYVVNRGISDSTSGWEIAEALIDYYRENIKCEPCDFQLKSMTKSIYTHLVYERAQRQGRPEIYELYRQQRAKQIIGNEWIFSPL